MGLFEVFRHLPRLIRRFKQLKNVLKGAQPPDLLVLIDFPDFNLRLARVAKAAGVPVLYYITPKVWAWRKRRARTIAENSDHLAVIFPFEPEIFVPYGVPVDYVGNPLLDEFAQCPPCGRLREELGIREDGQVVGLFPGSRQSEIKYIFDTLIDTARLLQRTRPDVKFLLPVAPSFSPEFFEQRLKQENLSVSVLTDNIYEVSAACDAVICVSGTATLQVTLTKTPMAVIYKISSFTYVIGKRLIKIPFAGLTNIVAGREVVREFIQDAATPEALCGEVIRIMDDAEYNRKIKDDLCQVTDLLGRAGCSERVVAIMNHMLTTKGDKDSLC